MCSDCIGTFVSFQRGKAKRARYGGTQTMAAGTTGKED
jgi:hypothetical protein